MGYPIRIGIIRAGESPEPDNYAKQFLERGCRVVDLFPGAPSRLSEMDGLVLSGGEDVDPQLYGEEPHVENDPVNRPYDDYEIDFLREAIRREVPVLAICRGHQVLNVALGGSLVQHIEGDGHRAYPDGGPEKVSRWHSIRVEPGSLLHRIYGETEFEVNSRHHQAVTADRIAPGLRAAAFSPDGFVEGLEAVEPRGWLVGVQWHPERPDPEQPNHATMSRRLFSAFLAAVRESRGALRAAP
jgi:putative glutamine amidotransferase